MNTNALEKTVAEEFLYEIKVLARQSFNLKTRTRNKLEPIMNGTSPKADAKASAKPNYPHYYAQLFDELKSIQNNLDAIDDYMDRVCFPNGDDLVDDECEDESVENTMKISQRKSARVSW